MSSLYHEFVQTFKPQISSYRYREDFPPCVMCDDITHEYAEVAEIPDWFSYLSYAPFFPDFFVLETRNQYKHGSLTTIDGWLLLVRSYDLWQNEQVQKLHADFVPLPDASLEELTPPTGDNPDVRWYLDTNLYAKRLGKWQRVARIPLQVCQNGQLYDPENLVKIGLAAEWGWRLPEAPNEASIVLSNTLNPMLSPLFLGLSVANQDHPTVQSSNGLFYIMRPKGRF